MNQLLMVIAEVGCPSRWSPLGRFIGKDEKPGHDIAFLYWLLGRRRLGAVSLSLAIPHTLLEKLTESWGVLLSLDRHSGKSLAKGIRTVSKLECSNSLCGQ